MINVLIVGRGKYALSIARLFRNSCMEKNQLRILLATTVTLDFGLVSRYVHKNFVIPRPDKSVHHFIDSLTQIIQNNAVHLIVPGAEEIFYVVKHKSRLPACKIFAPNKFELLNEVHNKYLFQLLLSEIGLKNLPSYMCSSIEEIFQQMQLFKDIGILRCILKPVYSRGGLDAVVCNSTSDLLEQKKYQKLLVSEENPYVIQPFVNGLHLSTFSVAIDGNVLFHTCYRTLLPFKGFGTIREEVDDKELFKWCTKFAKATKYTGHIGFDFIRGHIGTTGSSFHRRGTVAEIEESMTLYAIECNPRTTNGLDILSLKHEKVIWQAYMRFLGEIPFNEKNAKGSTTNEKLYVKNNNYYIRLRTTVPSIMAIMKVGGLQDTVDSLKLAFFDSKDDMFWWTDPLPFGLMIFRAFVQFFASLWTLAIKGIPLAKSAVQSLKNELVVFPPTKSNDRNPAKGEN